MKTLFQLGLAMLLCSTISAQSVITRISAGEDFYYYNNELQAALNDATAGDTILVPGHNYTFSPTIVTSVVLIGVGYDPASSSATGICLISGNLTVNAPNSEIIGLKITGNVSINNTALGSIMQRCKVEGNLNFGSSVNDIIITECIFANPSTSGSVNGSVNIGSADNIEINNCMIEVLTANTGSSECVFNNNIFFDGIQGVNNATLSCNVFDIGFNFNATTENDNIFNDNVVLDPACTDACLTSDLGSDNVSNNTLFVTGTSVFGAELPDYAVLGDDYLILNTSPAFTHCPVSQQVGVYGGPQPFKIGAIPFNPHVSSKSISGVSTTDQINVVVGVEAQDN